jgi:hypothetical protein
MIYVETRYANTLNEFKEYLVKNPQANWKLVGSPLDCQIALFFDIVESENVDIVDNLGVLKILVRQEPELVVPKNYDAALVAKFDHIIEIGKSREDLTKNINWPQDFSNHLNADNFKKDKFVIINSNLLSLRAGENYSLRRKVIGQIPTLDLYGFQWNNSYFDKLLAFVKEFKKYMPRIYELKLSGLKYYFKTFDNYLGAVSNKREVISLYKYSVVIENSCDYVSEKLFDAFLSGCFPVYVGPNLSRYDLPENLYIQAEPNFIDIKKKMVCAQETDLAQWSARLKTWLAEDRTYKNWSSELFFAKILNAINNVYQ